jgi:hypothetical protein
MAKKKDLPGWFPFALVATGLIAVAAGIRSKGKLSGETASAPPTPPPLKQAGVIQGWENVRLPTVA